MDYKKLISEAKTKNLVDFYNVNSGTSIKKFATRAVAERRVGDLIDSLREEGDEIQRLDLLTDQDDLSEVKAETAEVKQIEWPERSSKRSLGIARSWRDETIAAKRAQRSAVKVDGQWYGSVRKAFLALDLPLKHHIAFRMELKAAGAIEAFGHKWEVVPLNYE